MNKKPFKLTLVVSLLLSLFSCQENLYDGDKEAQNKSITELDVPKDFSWQTSQNVKCVVSAVGQSTVSVYRSKECSSADLLSTFKVSSDKKASLFLDLPTSLDKVYLLVDGSKVPMAVDVKEGKIDFTLPASAKVAKKSIQSRASDDYDFRTYYPADSWGTLMFEDKFPNMGDYDLNDIVENYKATIYGNSTIDGPEALGMELSFRVKAVGGAVNSVPALFLRKLNIKDIDQAYFENNIRLKNLDTKPKIKEFNGGVILIFEGAHLNPNKAKGCDFLNTVQGFMTTELVQIDLDMKFVNPIKAESLALNEFDFYIIKDNVTEIHLGGYTSTTGDYNFADPLLDKTRPFYNAKGLVWGLRVPKDIPHAIEKSNFLTAYPEFEAWVLSGGKINKDWYNKPQANIVPNIW